MQDQTRPRIPARSSWETSTVLARLGGLFSLRKLRPALRQDHATRADTLGGIQCQASQAQRAVRLVGCCLPITEPHGPDRPQRNHRRATTQAVTAPGKLNADGEERRRAVCGRTACTLRCGGARKPDQSATVAQPRRLSPTPPSSVRLLLATSVATGSSLSGEAVRNDARRPY
jgi:hypothetical protein